MGAAWRGPKDRDIEKVEEMVHGAKALDLGTCATLGMLEDGQANRLKSAGLDYYNHNLDAAPEFYNNVISTREYRDRLDTLGRVYLGTTFCVIALEGLAWQPHLRSGKAFMESP